MLYLKLQCQFKTRIIAGGGGGGGGVKTFPFTPANTNLAFLCWRVALMFVLILDSVKFGIMYNGELENH